MFNALLSNFNIKEENGKKYEKVPKYNLVRQKLFLEGIKSHNILNKLWENQKNGTYSHIIEETKIPALSVCRAIMEDDKTWVPNNKCYLVSQSYDPSNLFGLKGTNGQLIVYNHETCILENDCRKEKFLNSKSNFSDIPSLPYFKRSLPFQSYNSLILIQGQLERAFNLANSEYDTLFGDICDEEVEEIRTNYLELYLYMKDVYERNLRSDTNAEINWYEYKKKNSDVTCFYIHCRKRSRDKVLWYPKR